MAVTQEVRRIPTDEEIFAWLPPASYLGMPVTVYRNGHPEDGRTPELGFIMRPSSKSKKSVDITIPGARVNIENVRHVSDPRLLKQTNLREQGAWDYTSERVSLYERLDFLEARVAELEAAKSPKKKPVEDKE